jgi:hypothetical protein
MKQFTVSNAFNGSRSRAWNSAYLDERLVMFGEPLTRL